VLLEQMLRFDAEEYANAMTLRNTAGCALRAQRQTATSPGSIEAESPGTDLAEVPGCGREEVVNGDR